MIATSTETWARWHSSAEEPWNVARVAHLHRRAGFGANWQTLQRDLRTGPDEAIDRILAGRQDASFEPQEFHSMSQSLCDAAVSTGDINRLKAWWFFRLISTSDPLRERLALMWHHHFATSNVKVDDVHLMRQHVDTLIKSARGSFAELLEKVAKDPAMLIWLDAAANRQEHPNENLAREIMELFALGEGNYSENDIKEAARALTGWSVRSEKFYQDSTHHDPGGKTIFGESGPFDGDDLLRLLLMQPSAPRRVAFRICQTLLGEGVATNTQIEALGRGLFEHDWDIMWAVETVLRSRTFFDMRAIRSRVASPVDFVVGAIRSLDITEPPPSNLVLSEVASNLGQSLFEPPNVFGWPGGRAWLTNRALIGRANFAASLIRGEAHTARHPFDAKNLAKRYGFGDKSEVGTFYAQLLLGREELPPAFANATSEPNRLVIEILSSPEMQLS